MAAFSTVFAGIAAGLSLANASQQAGAITAQNDFNASMTGINKKRADMQGADAIERGNRAAGRYGNNVKKLIGSQKVAAAGQGVDISSGSAADIVSETEKMGAEDVQNIKTNAFRESLGYGMQKSDYEANQAMSASSAQTQRTSTLLGGALNASKYAFEQYGGGR